jgi:hypothetical protein
MPRCMSRARSRRGSRQRRGAVRLQARCGAHVAAHQRCRMVLHNRCVGTVGVGCRPRRRHCRRLDRCRGVGLERVVGVLVWAGTATVAVAGTVTLVVWCPSQPASSQPVPPVPVAPPRRSARQQAAGGGAVDVSASPVAPPLPRGQGVQQGKVRGQGTRGGHGAGGGAVPLPMPPPRGSSLRGVGGGGLGGRPVSPPAPPVPMPRVSSKGRGSGGGGGVVDGRVRASLQAAPAVRVTRARSRAQTQDAFASQGQCTPSPPAPPGPTHLQGRQGGQPGRHR